MLVMVKKNIWVGIELDVDVYWWVNEVVGWMDEIEIIIEEMIGEFEVEMM